MRFSLLFLDYQCRDAVMFFQLKPITIHPHFLDFCMVFLFTCSPISAWAQSGGKYDSAGTGGLHTIQGYVYLPARPRDGNAIKVKIESTNSTGLSVIADDNGGFTFRNLEPGPYYITVDAGEDFEVFKDTVNIDRETSKLGPRILKQALL